MKKLDFLSAASQLKLIWSGFKCLSASSYRGFVVAAVAILMPISSSAQPLTITLKSELKVGQTILAQIKAPGDVTIESDIAKSSFVAKGFGSRQVDLGNGKVAEFGFHRVKLISATNHVSLLLPILARNASMSVPEAQPLSRSEQTLLLKFFSNLKANGSDYLENWPLRKVVVEKVVKLTTVGTLVIVCLAEPSKLTCVPAAAAVGDVSVEAVFDYTDHAVNEMEKLLLLTKWEAATMRKLLAALKTAKVVISVGFGSGVAERVIEGLDLVTIALDEKSDLKLIIGLQKDSAGKAVKFIQILKKTSR